MSKKAWEKGNAAEALTPCYAAVDIGSNKIRLALYTLNAQGDVVEVDISEKRKFTCALAEGMTSDKGVIKGNCLAPN